MVLQFKGVPSEDEKKTLRNKGIELKDYIQNGAYYATIDEGDLPERLKNTAIISIKEPAPE